MRTTVDLDPALLEQIRLEAVRRGVSVKALLNSVIRAGLQARVTEAPPAYRLESVSLGEPLVDLRRALAVADALEDAEHLRDLHLRR